MGEVNYEPVIKDMVWSYSRIKAFDDCPYRWYLQYIRKLHGKDMFFSSYGSFIGENKLRRIISENRDADFIFWNGNRAQIKRKLFEKYIDQCELV